MLRTRAVTVTTSPTRLDSVSEAASSALDAFVNPDPIPGQSIAVYNASGVVVYMGGEDVSAANGIPVAASSWGPSVDLHHTAEAFYGVVEAGTAEVRVLEVGV